MTCIICGSQTISYQHPKFDMHFHECLTCEAIFKDAKDHITPTDEKNVYDLHENSIENRGYVNYLTNFIESAVIPHVTHKPIIALDYGSGPVPVLAQILKETFNIPTDIYDPFYAKTPIKDDQTYDLITSTEVIEHVKDPIKIFKQFKKHLKPEGLLAIMTLFHPKDRPSFFNWFYIRDHTHIVFYTPKTLDILAASVGLVMIDNNGHRHATFKHR
ncbi:MAG: class I SAM-dependent methyltransferase [Acholeplasmataceae bacterium]